MESATAPRAYDVLYFKRKNKVHKSKGVSKLDGRLVIQDGFAKLYEGATSMHNSNSKQQTPIHSLRNAEISKRVFQVDEEVALGQYSVEIVSVVHIDASKEITAKPGAASTLIKTSVPSINDRPTVKPKALIKSSTSVAASWLQIRKPPAQPKLVVKQSPDSDDDNDTSEEATRFAAPLLDRKEVTIKKKTLFSGQKRKLTMPSVAASAIGPLPSRMTPPFAGAIGTLVLPPSLRAAMRPHQLSGVVYLWNCLTGASANLRRIAEQAGVDQTPRGAILADSMGMGAFCLLISIEYLFPNERLTHSHSSNLTLRQDSHDGCSNLRFVSSQQAAAIHNCMPLVAGPELGQGIR